MSFENNKPAIWTENFIGIIIQHAFQIQMILLFTSTIHCPAEQFLSLLRDLPTTRQTQLYLLVSLSSVASAGVSSLTPAYRVGRWTVHYTEKFTNNWYYTGYCGNTSAKCGTTVLWLKLGEGRVAVNTHVKCANKHGEDKNIPRARTKHYSK